MNKQSVLSEIHQCFENLLLPPKNCSYKVDYQIHIYNPGFTFAKQMSDLAGSFLYIYLFKYAAWTIHN